MLRTLALAAIDHLLAREAWACERLRPFAGSSIAVTIGSFKPFLIAITPEGRAVAGAAEPPPALHAQLPAARLSAIVSGAPWWHDLVLDGDPAFAAAVRFLAEHLRWDPTDDLARLVGDIPAERLAASGRALHEWQRDARGRLAAGIGEYVSAEKGIVANRADIEALARENDELIGALVALDARIAALERSHD